MTFIPIFQTFLWDSTFKEILETMQKLQPFLDTKQPEDCLASFCTEEALRIVQALEPCSSSLCKLFHHLLKSYESNTIISNFIDEDSETEMLNVLPLVTKLVRMETFNPGQFA